MYIPKHFQVKDTDKLTAFIEKYSFGTLISQGPEEPFATHLPFLIEEVDGGTYYLYGHMARANPHWSYLVEGKVKKNVLVIFQGPHAYISPTWYQEDKTVPTWNYVSVHVYGEFSIIKESDTLNKLMNETISKYESTMNTPWTTNLDDDFNYHLMKSIVAFKIKISRFEGKWKLNQNHSEERRKRLINGLRMHGDTNSVEIADLIQETIILS